MVLEHPAVVRLLTIRYSEFEFTCILERHELPVPFARWPIPPDTFSAFCVSAVKLKGNRTSETEIVGAKFSPKPD
jgi:hypothetical protein